MSSLLSNIMHGETQIIFPSHFPHSLNKTPQYCRPENFSSFLTHSVSTNKFSKMLLRIAYLFSLPAIIPRVVTIYGCPEHLWASFISLYEFCPDLARLDWSIKAHT